MDKTKFFADDKKQYPPTRQAIRDFWDSQEGIELLSTKTGIVRSYSNGCYACGFLFSLERCHIIAKVNGGSYSVTNFHLLCRNCHIESEFFDNGDNRYWRWFRNKYIRDYKEPFQQTEDLFNLVDLSLKQILKLFYMGKKDEAVKLVAAQLDGAFASETVEALYKQMITNKELDLSDAQAEEKANKIFNANNQRIISKYREDEWK